MSIEHRTLSIGKVRTSCRRLLRGLVLLVAILMLCSAPAQRLEGGAKLSGGAGMAVGAGGGGGGGGAAAISAYTPSTVRNNFTGSIGFKFRVSSASTVTELGRWKVSGNSGSITVSIKDGANTTLASVSLNLTTSVVGQFNYVTLGSPLALSTGTDYYCVSDETDSGNEWYNATAATFASGVSNVQAAYYAGGWQLGDTDNAYVPPNFKFTAP